MKIKCITCKLTRKKVKARSTKHQVHFDINHTTSDLISILVDIIECGLFRIPKGHEAHEDTKMYNI